MDCICHGLTRMILGSMKNGLLSLVELAFVMELLSSFDKFFLGILSFFFFFFIFLFSLWSPSFCLGHPFGFST
jgi:hypothetical protein